MQDLQVSPSLHEVANPFLFMDVAVRTATDDAGNPWFCAKDIFDALDIKWSGTKASLAGIRENWQVVLYLKTSYGVKETIFLSEAGLYKVSFRSSKPAADRFTDWVCAEVLPALRRQGYYGKPRATDRLAASRQIASLTAQLVASHDAFAIELLARELRDVCNLRRRKCRLAAKA